nr:helix-turn-helix transcriptional regulator [Nocardia bovistercoris]
MLGRQLRALRENCGITMDFARETIGVGKQTLWRMETGQPIRMNPAFVEKLCTIYGASEQTTSHMLGLAAETGNTGWWHALDARTADQCTLYLGLESTATRVVSFQTTLLPGLFQTDEYRRALIWADQPRMPGAEVERHIELFDQQRALLDARRTLTVDATIDESALRRPVGGPAVMARQLTHLAKCAERENISIRIIPLTAAAHTGLRVGAFILLEFPPRPTPHLTDPPVVFVRGFTGNLYLEKADEVHRYRRAYTDIERSALDKARSRTLIRRIAAEYAP